jgi:thiol-disulfide isomerase/thioredoxin
MLQRETGALAKVIIMKRMAGLMLFGMLAVLGVQGTSFAAGSFTVDGAALARVEFQSPESREERQYLGLADEQPFKLSGVKAETLIVHVFSMYCPLCQADAPHVNQLYKMIHKDPGLKNKVKIVGIGTGNTPFEVEVFKKKFAIPFPLFSDENFEMQKACSQPIKTPVFVTVRLDRGKALKVVNVQVGGIREPEPFFKKLVGFAKRK